MHAQSSPAITFDEWLTRSAWPLGTVVQHPDDPAIRGQIVKRGGRSWAYRDKLPWVRWYGKLDAEQVPWERLIRA